MKITWFSPLPPVSGPAAELTVRVLPLLAERSTVVLMTGQESWDPALEDHATLVRTDLAEPRWAELNRSDMTVYNLDGVPESALLWQLSQRHPGLVILHDELLWPLFAELGRSDPVERERLAAHLEEAHGPGAGAELTACLAGALSEQVFAERYPLTALAARGQLAALVGSRGAAERLAASPCPVARVAAGEEDPGPWVESFLELLESAQRFRPLAMARMLGRLVTDELSLWSGFPGRDAGGSPFRKRADKLPSQKGADDLSPRREAGLLCAGIDRPHPLHRRVVDPVEDAVDELLRQTVPRLLTGRERRD